MEHELPFSISKKKKKKNKQTRVLTWWITLFLSLKDNFIITQLTLTIWT